MRRMTTTRMRRMRMKRMRRMRRMRMKMCEILDLGGQICIRNIDDVENISAPPGRCCETRP
jgi:hypothetical protein